MQESEVDKLVNKLNELKNKEDNKNMKFEQIENPLVRVLDSCHVALIESNAPQTKNLIENEHYKSGKKLFELDEDEKGNVVFVDNQTKMPPSLINGGSVEVRLNFEYLQDIFKQIKKLEKMGGNSYITFYIGTDKPLVIEQSIQENKTRWLLAPRVDAD